MFVAIRDAVVSEFADLANVDESAAIVFRLLLAAILGGILGYERESAGKATGMRTHMLVAIGAALFLMAPHFASQADDATSRVIQGIIAGIGFLGAGAIVKGKPGEEIYGLTTAASIWMTAAIGATVGLGRAGTATISTALAVGVLTAMQRWFQWIHPSNGGEEKRPGGDSRG